MKLSKHSPSVPKDHNYSGYNIKWLGNAHLIAQAKKYYFEKVYLTQDCIDCTDINNKTVFNAAAPSYEEALVKCGYDHVLNFKSHSE